MMDGSNSSLALQAYAATGDMFGGKSLTGPAESDSKRSIELNADYSCSYVLLTLSNVLTVDSKKASMNPVGRLSLTRIQIP